MSVQIQYGTRVKLDLSGIPKVTQAVREAAAIHLNLAAQSMEVLAKELAPHDTGFLEDNIRIAKWAKKDDLKATVESQANYSLYVEYGFNHWRGDFFVEAQPFFTPAFESARRQLEKVRL